MSKLHISVPRPVARVAVALMVAVVASTAMDATWDPRAAILLTLAAFWLPQTFFAAARRRR